LRLVRKAIGHKQTQVLPTADGVEERPVPAAAADEACLGEGQLQAGGTLLPAVEAHYRWPPDLEGGWAGGQLHLFQWRPVTPLPPHWTRDESAERFPNAMTPLGWDFMSEAFNASLAHSLPLMGLPRLKGKWFEIFDHYVYGNQNAVRLLAMYR